MGSVTAPEAYLGSCQKFNIEIFTKIVNSFAELNILGTKGRYLLKKNNEDTKTMSIVVSPSYKYTLHHPTANVKLNELAKYAIMMPGRSHLIFTCSNSTIETLKKDVKNVKS